MPKIYAFSLVLLVLSLFGCGLFDKRHAALEAKMSAIMGSKLTITDNVVSSDSSNFYEKFNSGRFKIVHYIDSSGCSECNLRTLYDWYRHTADSAFSPADFFFIIWSDSIKRSANALRTIGYDGTVYYDLKGQFVQKNEFFHNGWFNTILADSAQNIKVIGDFRGNRNLRKIYEDVISNKK